jgi:hypothetical protein
VHAYKNDVLCRCFLFVLFFFLKNDVRCICSTQTHTHARTRTHTLVPTSLDTHTHEPRNLPAHARTHAHTHTHTHGPRYDPSPVHFTAALYLVVIEVDAHALGAEAARRCLELAIEIFVGEHSCGWSGSDPV